MEKQLKMMKLILHYYNKMRDAVALQIPVSSLIKLGFSEKLISIKYDVPADDLSLIDTYTEEITLKLDSVIKERRA